MKLNLSLEPVSKHFFIRFFSFLLVYGFIVFVHPYITTYFYSYNFDFGDVYFAYLILPLFLILAYINWAKILSVGVYKNDLFETVLYSFVGLAFLLTPVQLDIFKWIGNEYIAYFFPLFIANSFMFLAVFNWVFVRSFLFEIGVILLTFCSYVLIQIFVEHYWIYLSYVVLYVLKFILPLFSNNVELNGLNVSFENFIVNIGPPCAGFYSMVTFAFLFIVTMLFVSRKGGKFNYLKSFLALLLGIAIAFIFNITRVTIIILVGGFVSEELAIGLFHEYLGAVLLIVLFVFYLRVVVPRLLVKKIKTDHLTRDT